VGSHLCMVHVSSVYNVLCRDGWKGRAIVALGCKQGTPLSMHPLLCAVSRPVRHARLAAALLR
jgi:hypothetical protein